MTTNFIQHSKNVLSLEECKSLIDFYEDNERYHTEGSSDIRKMDVSDKDKKGMEWKRNILYIGREQIKFQSGYFSSLGRVIVDGVNQYTKTYPFLNKVRSWQLSSNFKIKKYLPTEALSFTHCENSGYTDGEMERRMISWMIYLNDVFDGGETEFPSQEIKFQPRVGDMLIWPAYWTHPHHGIPSSSQIKYIVTGWFTYSSESNESL